MLTEVGKCKQAEFNEFLISSTHALQCAENTLIRLLTVPLQFKRITRAAIARLPSKEYYSAPR